MKKIEILVIEDNINVIALIIGKFFLTKKVKKLSYNPLEEIPKSNLCILSKNEYTRDIDSGYEIRCNVCSSLNLVKNLEINNSTYDFIIMDFNIKGGNTKELTKNIISSGFTNPIIANTDDIDGFHILEKLGAVNSGESKSSCDFLNFIENCIEEKKNKESA